MSAATEDGIDEQVPPSVLSGIKEEILVKDLINRMDIADGLKELLISSGFTVKSISMDTDDWYNYYHTRVNNTLCVTCC